MQTETPPSPGRLRIWAEHLKIEHTLFSVPLIYAGALLAEPPLTLRTGLLILVAATGARTAAMGLNRLLDHRLDAANPRTRNRALPSGRLTPRAAAVAVGVSYLVAILAAAAISPHLALLSPIPLAAFVVYPLLKRFTRWAHLGLGVAFSLGPLCGWYAVNLSLEHAGPALWLAGFTALWCAGFDILYATQDEVSDRETGVHSLPAAVGSRRALRIAIALHATAFVALCGLYLTSLGGAATGLAVLVAGALFIVQHRIRHRVDLAFFHVNAALGAVVFLGVALHDFGAS